MGEKEKKIKGGKGGEREWEKGKGKEGIFLLPPRSTDPAYGSEIVCMTAMIDVTPKTTEQNRIVRTGKLI